MIECKVTDTVDDAVLRALALFQGNFNQLDSLAQKFVAKPCGHEMYFTGKNKLGDFVHIQNVIKYGIKV